MVFQERWIFLATSLQIPLESLATRVEFEEEFSKRNGFFSPQISKSHLSRLQRGWNSKRSFPREMDFSRHKSPNPTWVACNEGGIRRGVFHMRWIFLTTSFQIFRWGWNSETSGKKSISHGKPYKMHFLAYFTSCRSWKPCEKKDLSHNCSQHGGKLERFEKRHHTFVVCCYKVEYVIMSQHDRLIDLGLSEPGSLLPRWEDLNSYILAPPPSPPHLTKPTLPDDLLRLYLSCDRPLNQERRTCTFSLTPSFT